MQDDELPEHHDYSLDDGCSYHPHCLTCPLPVCRFDSRGGLRAAENVGRREEVRRLRAQRLKLQDIADRMGISLATVRRLL